MDDATFACFQERAEQIAAAERRCDYATAADLAAQDVGRLVAWVAHYRQALADVRAVAQQLRLDAERANRTLDAQHQWHADLLKEARAVVLEWGESDWYRPDFDTAIDRLKAQVDRLDALPNDNGVVEYCDVCGELGVQVEVRPWGVAIRVCQQGHKWVTRPQPGTLPKPPASADRR